MKKLIIILLTIQTFLPVYSKMYEGTVYEQGNNSIGRIIDKTTGMGIPGAKITLPKEHYSTKTNQDGYFELDTFVNKNSIMSVKKDKYKPFSLSGECGEEN